ncbi:MFS transporter, partial [Staphylococcus aureus]
MTTTFIISYIILALIIVGVINLLLIRSRRKAKRQQKEQHFATRQSNQSKFKASDLDRTTDQSSQHTAREEARIDNKDNQNQVSLTDHAKGSEQDQELFNDNKDDEAFAAKNPESEEYKVNEKIKKEHTNYIFGEGVSRGKILAALLFGMFIAILNQTLLNVALPKINTEFNISASTGQWLMTGFMLVNGILIPITAYLFNKYSYRKLFLVALVLFTIGSLICAISMNFPIMMVGRVLQAIGAGVLMPLGSIVIITIYP